MAVTGSIACIKTAALIRLLIQAGAEVKVVLSKGALDFIQPLTFAALSGNPVHSDFTENKDAGTWVNHVHLALWADACVVAPCSANTLSNIATGQCDSFLMAVIMSLRCPLWIAPAMDHDMYTFAATQDNIHVLKKRGVTVLPTGEGALASGLMGKGRMMEPEEIFANLQHHFSPQPFWQGKNVLITAGPTHEALDPVRFIGNHSSGKMGYALAEQAAAWGAHVTLVTGPTHLEFNRPFGLKIPVTSAAEMHRACMDHFPQADVVILAAAVADYTPETVEEHKIKKKSDELTLKLVKTKDIAAELGAAKKHQKIIGFALETEKLVENATQKLHRKNMDLIVANTGNEPETGFGADTNTITMIWPNGRSWTSENLSKKQLAVPILEAICNL